MGRAEAGDPGDRVMASRELRPYGVRPRTLWIGEEAAKENLNEDLNEVFGRYIPRKEAKALLEEISGHAERTGAESAAPAVGVRK